MKQQGNRWRVREAAVLGAGVMGTQIAAHLANAGIKTALFDLKSTDVDPNSLVNQSLRGLGKLKPSPITSKATLLKIWPANYDDDLPKLKQCDLIIEAISERMDWKTNLYKKIEPYIHENALLATNTSGLSISQLSEHLPSNLRARFCGVHFFNPPRYMKLVEIIPHSELNEKVLDNLSHFVVSHLGKGTVIAKDTPNFIGNRIGVFSLLSILHHAARLKLQPDIVDILTGVAIGRPKSATYRTLDVVGLDVFSHVVKTQAGSLQSDPWHALFKVPDWISTLVDKGALGKKANRGIYKKVEKEIHVIDPYDGSYRLANKKMGSDIQHILAIKEPNKRFQALKDANSVEATFLKAIYTDLFLYVSHHLSEIAYSPRDIDLAMRWGYGWEKGPFESWQAFGWDAVNKQIEKELSANNTVLNISLPPWVNQLDKGIYCDGKGWSIDEEKFVPFVEPSVYQRQLHRDTVLTEALPLAKKVHETSSTYCFTYDDETLILSFKTKKNTISKEVLLDIQQAITMAEASYLGLVLWQEDAQNFSLGANIHEVAALVQNGRFDEVEQFIKLFQETASRIKYAVVPVVAAIRGRVLGGGCELAMHADKVVAASETYMGLVETGIGIIPAGAGCKELAQRASDKGYEALEGYFQTLVRSEVSQSAEEAKEKGFLKSDDLIVQNADEVLWVAIQTVQYLSHNAYRPPVKVPVKVFGQEALANFKAILANWHVGQFISDHDLKVGSYLAEALTGGQVDSGTRVEEAWLLSLEFNGTFSLLKTKETQDRVAHTLKTGKPLRN